MQKLSNSSNFKDSNNLLYSLIIPTYNERENISILIYLIDKYMNEK